MDFEAKIKENLEGVERFEFPLGGVIFRGTLRETDRNRAEATNGFLFEKLEIVNKAGEAYSLLSLLPPDWQMTLVDDSPVAQSEQFSRELRLPRFQTKVQKEFGVWPVPDGALFLEHAYALFEILHEVGHTRHKNREISGIQVSQLEEEEDCWDFALDRIQELKARSFELGEGYEVENLKKFARRSLQTYKEGGIS